MFSFGGLLGLGIAIFVIIIIAFIAILVFEITMFVHCIKNHKIADNYKVLWLIGMLFIHPFVAIAYYLTDYKKSPPLY
jgi:hypothetical protein